MQRADKLTGLIDQAASAINMLSATDLSGVENLQTILDQIKQNIAEISNGPAPNHFRTLLHRLQRVFMLRAYPNNRLVMRPSEKFEAKAAGIGLPLGIERVIWIGSNSLLQ